MSMKRPPQIQLRNKSPWLLLHADGLVCTQPHLKLFAQLHLLDADFPTFLVNYSLGLYSGAGPQTLSFPILSHATPPLVKSDQLCQPDTASHVEVYYNDIVHQTEGCINIKQLLKAVTVIQNWHISLIPCLGYM